MKDCIVSREVYKKVKRYDRQQFEGFCMELYKNGYNDGAKSVPGVDLTKVMEAIGSVKGIGEKRLTDIKEALEQMFQ